MTPVSAYGYTYDIDFADIEVRGDMDLRYVRARRMICSWYSFASVSSARIDILKAQDGVGELGFWVLCIFWGRRVGLGYLHNPRFLTLWGTLQSSDWHVSSNPPAISKKHQSNGQERMCSSPERSTSYPYTRSRTERLQAFFRAHEFN